MPLIGRLSGGGVRGKGLGLISGFVSTLSLSSSTSNYNLSTALTAAGWDGVTKVNASITIDAGVVISSSSTGTYAFTISGLPAGSSVMLTNNGTIIGRGGNAGSGGQYQVNGAAGSTGGPALYTSSPLILINNGTIAGGGGGGGGGCWNYNYIAKVFQHCAGGGGGGGAGNGAGAAAGTYNGTPNGVWYSGSSGSNGTATAGGAGGAGGYYNSTSYGGTGGAGGAPGSSGSTGGLGVALITTQYSPGAGGAGGAAVVGNSYITYNVTGTITGSIT